MKTYNVRTNQVARSDVLSIARRIKEELQSPDAARFFVDSIIEAASSLSQMPYRNSVSKRVHQIPGSEIGEMLVGEHIIIYVVDEETSSVFILGVVYARRSDASFDMRVGRLHEYIRRKRGQILP